MSGEMCAERERLGEGEKKTKRLRDKETVRLEGRES